MQKSYEKNSIPDLRRKDRYMDEIDLKYLSIRYFVPAVIMITILMIGVMMVSATHNYIYPSSM